LEKLKAMKALNLIIILLLIQSCVFSSKHTGLYHSNIFSLKLNKDKTYYIENKPDFYLDTGTWKLINDTLILNSKEIPKNRVIQKCNEKGDSLMEVKVINQFGEELIGASLYINDSLYVYERQLEKLCIPKVENLEVIYLPFVKEFKEIKKDCSDLEIIIYDVDMPFKKYYFNEKLVFLSDTALMIDLYGRNHILKK
jgi:hypothetical protein